MIEYTKICKNIKGHNFEKSICSSPSTHDNKNWHQLSSHCRISDEWRCLVHRCEAVPHPLDLLKLRLTQSSFRQHISSQSSKLLTSFFSMVWFTKHLSAKKQQSGNTIARSRSKMDKLKYDYKAYFSVAKKIKFRVKSSKNKFLRKISRISGNYGSKCVKNVSQTKQLVRRTMIR